MKQILAAVLMALTFSVMNRTRLLLLALLPGALLALAGIASDANADTVDSAFLAKIRQNDFDFYYMDDANVVKVGHLTCQLLGEGNTADQVAAQMNTYTPAIVTRSDEDYFIETAEVYFCPRFDGGSA